MPPGIRARVVVVTGTPAAGRSLAAFLDEHGYDALVVHDTDAAINAFAHSTAALVCDARAKHIDGLAVLDQAIARALPCAVMIATAETRALAVEAVRRGAWDYQLEPLDRDRLLASLRLGLEHQRLARRVAELEDQLERQFGVRGLTGSSRAIQRVREVVRRAATTRAAVTLEGEPGTGKSMVARALHHASARRERRLERVRCGAMPEALLEVELFGSARGSTGTPGALERADGGTLFLDEIDRLPHSLQMRLLRFLLQGRFERVGDATERRADVRIVAASGVPLEELVRRARFHPDLYSGLSVLRIEVPPLRERLEDLPALVEELVRAANREHRRRVPGVTAGVLDHLAQYTWPGNVRELRNVIDGMVATARGRNPLDLDSLPDPLRGANSPAERLELSVGMTLEAAERRLIEATLAHTRGDKPRAAAMLGIGLRTLYRRLDAWGLRG